MQQEATDIINQYTAGGEHTVVQGEKIITKCRNID
jgi:hypothetical protein